LSGINNIGLALLKLETVSNDNATVDLFINDEIKLRAFAPKWLL
jgi:hypothetical protein